MGGCLLGCGLWFTLEDQGPCHISEAVSDERKAGENGRNFHRRWRSKAKMRRRVSVRVSSLDGIQKGEKFSKQAPQKTKVVRSDERHKAVVQFENNQVFLSFQTLKSTQLKRWMRHVSDMNNKMCSWKLRENIVLLKLIMFLAYESNTIEFCLIKQRALLAKRKV